MSQDSAFAPWGPTVLVGTSVVQVPAANVVNPTSYRIRCLVTGYLSWAPSSGPTAPTIPAPTAPTAGVPSINTIGMVAAGTPAILALPPNAYFISNNAAGFEITPGEGM